jgi:hypothetical protein
MITLKNTIGLLVLALGVAASITSTISVAADGPGHSHLFGYGKCGRSGCYCRAFEGNGNTCSNCGHAYSAHY